MTGRERALKATKQPNQSQAQGDLDLSAGEEPNRPEPRARDSGRDLKLHKFRTVPRCGVFRILGPILLSSV